MARAAIRLSRSHCIGDLNITFFTMPVELWLSMAQHWLTVRRSLLTGDSLGRQLREVH